MHQRLTSATDGRTLLDLAARAEVLVRQPVIVRRLLPDGGEVILAEARNGACPPGSRCAPARPVC